MQIWYVHESICISNFPAKPLYFASFAGQQMKFEANIWFAPQKAKLPWQIGTEADKFAMLNEPNMLL